MPSPRNEADVQAVLLAKGYTKKLDPEMLDFIIRHEGGLVDHPKDPGGLTKYGISLRACPWLGRDGVKALSEEQAGMIYRRLYFDAVRASEYGPSLALVAFDCAVNQGVGFCSRALQKAVRVAPDGVIGPQTLRACRIAGLPEVERLLLIRLDRYMQNPNFSTFGLGWMRRLQKVGLHAGSLHK